MLPASLLSAVIRWNADPVLIDLGFRAIRWYGAFFAVGFAVGYLIVRWMFEREGKDTKTLDKLLITLLVGTVVGARVGHCFFYNPAYYLAHPIEVLYVWKGGLASHGGLIGIVTAIWVYAKTTPGQGYLWTLDRIVVPTALVGCLIRLGNLMNSELLGRAADVPWAFVFVRVDPATPRHPVVLYESLSYLATFAVLFFLYKRWGGRIAEGLLTGWFLVLVFGSRFVNELFKARLTPLDETSLFSMGQVLSIVPVLVGLWLVARAVRSRSSRERPRGRGQVA